MPTLKFSRYNAQEERNQIPFIDREIQRWEAMNTDGRIMRCHYETESALEKDWYKFMSQPYELKVLSNNRAYKYYGMKNEEIYHKFKSYFMSHDTIQSRADSLQIYAPKSTLYESTAVSTKQDQQANDIMNSTGYYIITNNNKSPHELEQQFYKFMSMSKDKRVKSDTFSIQIYGKKNEERYNDMLTKLLSREEVPTEPEDSPEYKPNPDNVLLTEDTIYHDPIDSVVNNYECAREFIVEGNISPTDAVIVVEGVLSENVPETPLEKFLCKSLLEAMINKINSYQEENYLGGKTPYFLPEEMDELGIFKEDNSFTNNAATPTEWFDDYRARSIGLKPRHPIASTEWYNDLRQSQSNDDKYGLLKLGWNPAIPVEDEAPITTSKRTNGLIQKKLGYQFCNLMEMCMGNAAYDFQELRAIPGIFVVFIDMEEDQNTVDRVYVGFDSTLSKLYPFTQGVFNVSTTLNDLRKLIGNKGTIKVYMIRFNDELAAKVQEMIKFFIDHRFDYRYKYSYINDIASKLKVAHPYIANERLFCILVVNMILGLVSIDYKNPAGYKILPTVANMKNDPNNKDFIYEIYQGDPNKYNPRDISCAIRNTDLIKFPILDGILPGISKNVVIVSISITTKI